MLGYTSRLKSDLARWRAEGRITPEQEASLYADALSHSRGVPITTVVGLLGAALLGLAVITFVAANWEGMTKLSRLAVLLGALWAAYGAAYALFRTGHSAFAEMALLLAGAIFGANIMLIAQTYHLSGYTPDAILLWAAGVLLAAALLRSTPSLVLAIGLMTLWIVWDATDRSIVPLWHFGLAWLLCAGLAIRQGSVVALHAIAIGLIVWMITIGIENRVYWPFALAGLAGLAAGLGTEKDREPESAGRRFLPALAIYGGLVAAGALILQQLDIAYRAPLDLDRVEYWSAAAILGAILGWLGASGRLCLRRIAEIALFAALSTVAMLGFAHGLVSELAFQVLVGSAVTAGAVWLIVRGTLDGRRGLAVVGFLGFAAELLYIYTETFGSLLSTSLFYLVAGLMLVGLSIAFVWLERRRAPDGTRA